MAIDDKQVEQVSKPFIEIKRCLRTPKLSQSWQNKPLIKTILIPSNCCGTKRNNFEDIVNSWEGPSEVSSRTEDDSLQKEARLKNSLLGAIKKTGIQRDKSPEELLRSVDLSWASIPFTSSWDFVNDKPPDKETQSLSCPELFNFVLIFCPSLDCLYSRTLKGPVLHKA